MSHARLYQPLTSPEAQQLYKNLFNSVSSDLRNRTDSYEQRMGRIYMTLYNTDGIFFLKQCMTIINDENIKRPLAGTMQQHIHQTMMNELNIAHSEYMSGCNMRAHARLLFS